MQENMPITPEIAIRTILIKQATSMCNRFDKIAAAESVKRSQLGNSISIKTSHGVKKELLLLVLH